MRIYKVHTHTYPPINEWLSIGTAAPCGGDYQYKAGGFDTNEHFCVSAS